MAEIGISERVRNFVFQFIDSAELLDVLLVFQKDKNRTWDKEELAKELRSNPNSVEKRVLFLKSIGLISESSASATHYFYDPSTPEKEETVLELATVHKVQRHKLFELIFSPMKKARDFADAFRGSAPKKEGDDG